MLKKISKSELFLKGCDIWVSKPPSDSKISMQLDFELNFLITKSQRNKKSSLDSLSEKICNDFNLQVNHDYNSDFTLIECSNLLPTRWLLITNLTQEKKKIYECISQLKCQSARIFFDFNLDLNQDFSTVDTLSTIEVLEDPGWNDSIKL